MAAVRIRSRGRLAERPRVLVVDDDDAIAELVREALFPEGYAVATAPHGASALEMVRLHDPDLILVDLRMPIMDGWSFIEQYRRRGGRARIIAFTALGDAADRGVPGADAALAKPFELDALLGLVGGLMHPAPGTGPSSPVVETP